MVKNVQECIIPIRNNKITTTISKTTIYLTIYKVLCSIAKAYMKLRHLLIGVNILSSLRLGQRYAAHEQLLCTREDGRVFGRLLELYVLNVVFFRSCPRRSTHRNCLNALTMYFKMASLTNKLTTSQQTYMFKHPRRPQKTITRLFYRTPKIESLHRRWVAGSDENGGAATYYLSLICFIRYATLKMISV